MDASLLPIVVLVSAGVIGVFQIVILILLVRLLRNPSNDIKDIESVVIGHATAKSRGIIRQAMEHSNRILANAELQGIKLYAQKKLTGDQLSGEFKSHIEEVEKALMAQFERNAQLAQVSYTEYIQQLEQAVLTSMERNEKMIEEKATTMLSHTEALLNASSADMQNRVKAELEKEMLTLQKEVEEYKHTRMRIMDEKIIDILEEVIKTTLGKSLSLAEQSELIYRALEEAKKDNAFTHG